MRRVLRLVIHYRYLLAACFVLAATIGGEYWVAQPPSPSAPPAPTPYLRTDLPGKYPLIEKLATRHEIEGVLGPPTREQKTYRTDICVWIDDQKNICVAYFAGDWRVGGPSLHRVGTE